MGSSLQVADRRMTTTVTLLLAQSLGAGPPPLVCHVMGHRLLQRCAFAQGGPTTLGLDLGAELLLDLCVLAAGQTPAVLEPGLGPRRAHRTRITGPGRTLGVLAWDHRHGLAVGTGDRAVLEVQSDILLGTQRPALRPGAGKAVHTWRGPWGHPRARQRPQGDVPLEQARALLHLLRQQRDGLMLRWVGLTHHPLARDLAVPVQGTGLLAAIERCGAALAAVAHGGVLQGEPSVGGPVLRETPRARSPLRIWLGLLCANRAYRLQS